LITNSYQASTKLLHIGYSLLNS